MDIYTFKRQVGEALKEVLAEQGYLLIEDSARTIEGLWSIEVWFNKVVENKCYQITIQPSVPGEYVGFVEQLPIVRFAVNLCSNYWLDPDLGEVYKDITTPMHFRRLASSLWIQDRTDPAWESDHWYSCFDSERLTESCHRVDQELKQYGIPWLESPAARPPWVRRATGDL
jgi:hypothetical protein